MKCEDCKNYQPKGDIVFQETAEEVNNILHKYCILKNCEDCSMGTKKGPCVYSQVKNLLKNSGWKENW